MRQNKFKLIYALLLLVVLSFSSESSGQQSKVTASTEEEVAESVKLVPCNDKDRREAVRKLFLQMGLNESEITIEKYNKDKISNVVVKKKGKSDETVVIGAHYDKTADGCGAIDNWTGVSIVAHLIKSLRQIETQKSYIFVAFDQEEKGLLGSDAMAKAIPKENRPQYCAMINFDSFGFAAPMALQGASSSKMISIAKKLAQESKFKFFDVPIEGASTDSASFQSRNIPAIALGGLDGNWQNYLHTRNDKVEKINMTSVYLGYRFGLLFAAKLDSMSCQEIK